MTKKFDILDDESITTEELEHEMENLIYETINDKKIEHIENKSMLLGIVLSVGRKIMHYMDDNELTFQEKTELVSFILPKIVDVLVDKKLIPEENVEEYKEYIELSVPHILFVIDILVTKIDEIDGKKDNKLKINENCSIPCVIL